MSTAASLRPELSASEFDALRAVIEHVAGIHVPAGKEQLLRSRLAPRLAATSSRDFAGYLELLRRSPAESDELVDAVTTNETSFFREREHFQLLQTLVSSVWSSRTDLKVWSAACSSGEEPYSIAAVLRSNGGAVARARVLATDICRPALETARTAIYEASRLERAPEMAPHVEAVDAQRVRIRRDLSDLVTFARLNLMGEWPMQGPFDVVFCRNVMIYFDTHTRRRLVERFSKIIPPGGFLFLGHAETLPKEMPDFRYVQPATYERIR